MASSVEYPENRQTRPRPEQRIIGGGDVGATLRATGAPAAQLGPVEQWPQPLCTALTLCLNSPQPMVILWGQEFVCFYNDAYGRLVGDTQAAAALGRPLQDAWPTLWLQAGPQLQAALETGDATIIEAIHVENAPGEETGESNAARSQRRAKLACSPIYDEQSQVAGLLIVVTEVTAQEEALRAEVQAGKEMLERVLGQLNDHYVLFDRNWRYVYVNDKAAVMLGLPKEQLIGNCIWELFPDAVGNYFYQQVHLALAEQRDLVFEYFYPPFGYWIENRVYASPDGVAVFSTDITERKQAEQKLRHSEERYRALLQTISPVVWSVDPVTQRGDYLKAQQWWEELTGQPISEQTLYGWLDAVHPDDREQVEAAWALTLATGADYNVEYRACRPDGRYAHVAARAVPVWSDDGKVLELVGTLTDISDRKQAEEVLARYRLLSDRAQDIILFIRQDGQIVEANRAAVAAYGYDRETLLTKTIFDLRAASSGLEVAEQMAYADIGGILFETVHVRSDGSTFPVEVSSIGADIGSDRLLLSIIRDITERKQAEENLRELNATLEQRVQERTAELERSNRELDQFAYIASHDLRAPLRAINYLASWIAEDSAAVLPETSKAHLAKIHSRIARMESLLNDLLTFSRVTRQHHPPEQVNTGELVRNVVELLAPPAGLTVTVEPTLPTLQTERVPLETVFRNLIGNAIKHHHQPDAAHIQVTAEQRRSFVVFSVKDNGPGIDPRFHERIFQIFQTLRPRDQVESSGMGLALVKRIVENRGGRVGVESSVGHGATFRFTWPVQTLV